MDRNALKKEIRRRCKKDFVCLLYDIMMSELRG